MEHEAREARPIGAQGAFASNSMHYTYTRALSPPISLWSPGYALANRETFASKRTHRSAPFDDFFALSSFDPRNLTREICRRLTPGDDEVTHPRLCEGAHAISRNRCTGWRSILRINEVLARAPVFFPRFEGLERDSVGSPCSLPLRPRYFNPFTAMDALCAFGSCFCQTQEKLSVRDGRIFIFLSSSNKENSTYICVLSIS